MKGLIFFFAALIISFSLGRKALRVRQYLLKSGTMSFLFVSFHAVLLPKQQEISLWGNSMVFLHKYIWKVFALIERELPAHESYKLKQNNKNKSSGRDCRDKKEHQCICS
ncbi:MAG: hypothetical protein LBQ64_06170 [Bacteroidales bacterium]|jgi:hypothetical protein|nr:hypothetical protein [Bacteroidales bacterium]